MQIRFQKTKWKQNELVFLKSKAHERERRNWSLYLFSYKKKHLTSSTDAKAYGWTELYFLKGHVFIFIQLLGVALSEKKQFHCDSTSSLNWLSWSSPCHTQDVDIVLKSNFYHFACYFKTILVYVSILTLKNTCLPIKVVSSILTLCKVCKSWNVPWFYDLDRCTSCC